MKYYTKKIVYLLLLWCSTARAEIEMFSASAARRNNFILDLPPIKKFANVTLTQCLNLCKRNDCKSFNYGSQECSLLSSFYCESEDTRKALKVQQGFKYYDVSDDPVFERSSNKLYSTECITKQECSTKCLKECLTDGNKGYGGKDIKCVFPFVYKGQKYNGCTEASHSGYPWCSTNTESQEYERYKWGTCNKDCPMHKD